MTLFDACRASNCNQAERRGNGMTLREQVNDFERRLIIRMLRKSHGDVAAAGELLETSTREMKRRCRMLGIDPAQYMLSYHGDYTKKRREWLRTQGLCFNCEKRPVGGDGGTTTMCPVCAEARRQAEKLRARVRARLRKSAGLPTQPRAAVPRPSHAAPDALLRLAAMTPKRAVTVDDLRRKAVC